MHAIGGLPSVVATSRGPAAHNTVPIDPSLLDDIEKHSQDIAKDVLGMLDKLTDKMGDMSRYTHQSVSVMNDATASLSSTVDQCVSNMVELITAVESLNEDMNTAEILANQIKAIHGSLGELEAAVPK
ncbi:hypothetical protein BC832DRAFT_590761 [Gaertneriomyces semiglobifer]|nr:hypothetical protein BC832DRAFT_590761 [Gaertneriomyces semiglobifer]